MRAEDAKSRLELMQGTLDCSFCGRLCSAPPTSCSWLNLVERWFRNLTQQRPLRLADPVTRTVEQENRGFGFEALLFGARE